MRKGFCYILSILTLVLTLPVPTGAQNIDWLRAPKKSAVRATECDTMVILPWFDEELANDVCVLDSMNIEPDTVITEPLRPMYPIPLADFRAAADFRQLAVPRQHRDDTQTPRPYSRQCFRLD